MWSGRLLAKLGGVTFAVWLIAFLTGLYAAQPSSVGSFFAVIVTALLPSAVAAGLTIWMVNDVKRPLADVTAAAKAMAAGNYDFALPPADDAEFAELSRSFARISRVLSERTEQVRYGGDQLATVLGS